MSKLVCPKVEQLDKNHCVITVGNTVIFYSYNTPICYRTGWQTFLGSKYNYSKTTVKHLCKWLNITSKELHENVKNGVFKLADLV